MKCKLCNLAADGGGGPMQCACHLTTKERSLPVWAQRELDSARHRLSVEGNRRRQLEAAHSILKGRDWFMLNGPHPDDEKPLRYLYWDICTPACSLGVGDVLLIGRREVSK
jgi:hypothetical protein